MSTVTIACSVAGGLIIGPLPDSTGNPVTVKLTGPPAVGPSQLSLGYIATAGFTDIDSVLWANFLATYATNPIVTENAVWEV